MKTFDRYAEFYDALYRDKDYKSEAGFVTTQLGIRSGQQASILEFGCGTGMHAECFLRDGLRVSGMDLSERMVEKAKSRFGNNRDQSLVGSFEVGDIRDHRMDESFDFAVSLFHVVSYQPDNHSLARAFSNFADHVRPGGRLVFDFWYGPAVLSDRPAKRIKEIETAHFLVRRTATPVIHVNRNLVDVNYEIVFEDKSDGAVDTVYEKHVMRYLFLPELESLLDGSGFDVIASGKWLSDEPLSDKTWYGWISAERRQK